MRILIGKAFHRLLESLKIIYLCKHGQILLSLTFKENTISFHYIQITEIPTNKGANSYKLKLLKIGNYLLSKTKFHLDTIWKLMV